MADPSKKREADRRYREANRERIREYHRSEAVKARKRENARRRRAENPEKYRAKDRAFRETHREQRKAWRAAWFAANPDRAAAYIGQRRARRAANLEMYRERARKWAQDNPDRVLAHVRGTKARRRGAPGRATADQVAARWAYYGGCCWMCGAPATEVDHVKPLAAGGSHWPANQRPACGPCNRKKHALWPYAA